MTIGVTCCRQVQGLHPDMADHIGAMNIFYWQMIAPFPHDPWIREIRPHFAMIHDH